METTFKKIGFSGTQLGMELRQKLTLEQVLRNLRIAGADELHHGDCVGADDEAHNLAKRLGYWIGIRPAENMNKRAFCEGADKVWEPKPALERNRDIVIAVDFMVFAPSGRQELRRSGTWMTYRVTRKLEKPRILIYPDGSYYSLTDLGRGWVEELPLNA